MKELTIILGFGEGVLNTRKESETGSDSDYKEHLLE
jgi:hypothetical protein